MGSSRWVGGVREAFRRESRLKESKEVDIGEGKVAMLLDPNMV